MRVKTVFVFAVVVAFSTIVTAQQGKYYEGDNVYASSRRQISPTYGTNDYSLYQQRVLNRRAQQPQWSNSDGTLQKPSRTHYGQTLSR